MEHSFRPHVRLYVSLPRSFPHPFPLLRAPQSRHGCGLLAWRGRSASTAASHTWAARRRRRRLTAAAALTESGLPALLPPLSAAALDGICAAGLGGRPARPLRSASAPARGGAMAAFELFVWREWETCNSAARDGGT